MFTRSYQLALFSSQGRLVLNLQAKGWMLLAAPAVLCILAIGNYILFDYYQMHRQLQDSRVAINLQSLQLNEDLLAGCHTLANIEDTLNRVVDFNAKLRIMLSIGNTLDRDSTLSPSASPGHGLKRLPALYGRDLTRNLRGKLEDLDAAILHEEVQQQTIAHYVSLQMESLATIPVIMPTKGRFSSAFGWRKDPFKGLRRFHKGIDITARTGTPVRATANGFVTQVSRSPSYGLVILLTHSDMLRTRYAHLSGFAVEEGQRVLRGQLVGYVGNTGRSKAPHLHYEVHYNNKPVNPRNYILQ